MIRAVIRAVRGWQCRRAARALLCVTERSASEPCGAGNECCRALARFAEMNAPVLACVGGQAMTWHVFAVEARTADVCSPPESETRDESIILSSAVQA